MSRSRAFHVSAIAAMLCSMASSFVALTDISLMNSACWSRRSATMLSSVKLADAGSKRVCTQVCDVSGDHVQVFKDSHFGRENLATQRTATKC